MRHFILSFFIIGLLFLSAGLLAPFSAHAQEAKAEEEAVDLPVDRSILIPEKKPEIKETKEEAETAEPEIKPEDTESKNAESEPASSPLSEEEKKGEAVSEITEKADDETKESEAETPAPSSFLIGKPLTTAYRANTYDVPKSETYIPWMAEVGIPDPLDRGLFYNFWYESKAGNIIALINQLRPIAGSPVLRDMVMELLVSSTAAPQFDPQHLYQQDKDMAKARLGALIRFGAFDEATLLYHQMKRTGYPLPQSVAQLGIDAMALGGSADAACLENSLLVQSVQTEDLLKDRALCAVFWFEKDLAVEILRHLAPNIDKENKNDAAFIAVLNSLKKNTPLRVRASMPPLWRALLLARKGRVRSADTRSKDMVLAASLAYNPYVSDNGRLSAAKHIADNGLLNLAELREFYQTTPVDDSTINAVRNNPGKWWKNDHFLLYKAARGTHDVDAKAAILKAGLKKTKDKTSIEGYLWTDIVRELTYNASKFPELRETARSLLYINQYVDTAHKWLVNDTLEKEEENMYNDVRNVILENHYSEKALEDETLTSWVDWVMETYPDTGQLRAQKALSVLHVTKERIPHAIWQKTGGRPKEIQLDLSFLEEKKDGKKKTSSGINIEHMKKGDTYLALLAYLGRNPLDEMSADEVYTLLKELEEKGLAAKNLKIGLEIAAQSVL